MLMCLYYLSLSRSLSLALSLRACISMPRASNAHTHLPSRDFRADELWPSKATTSDEKCSTTPAVPMHIRQVRPCESSSDVDSAMLGLKFRFGIPQHQLFRQDFQDPRGDRVSHIEAEVTSFGWSLKARALNGKACAVLPEGTTGQLGSVGVNLVARCVTRDKAAGTRYANVRNARNGTEDDAPQERSRCTTLCHN